MINAIYFYRIARWLYLCKIPLLPKIITLFIFLIYNSKIPFKAQIGKGTFFVYGGIGNLVNEDSKIGNNCSIGVGVKIVGKGPYKKGPIIGNNVFIGPGAVIQGPVIIEDFVIIAPNAVVTKSIHAYSIVAGVPAKIIGDARNLDFDIFKNENHKEGHIPFL